MSTTIQEAQRDLVAYMRALSEEHTSANWLIHWEHLLWDAMRSDGQLRGYDEYDTEEAPIRLTEVELRTLRRLAARAGVWFVMPPNEPSDMRYMYALDAALSQKNVSVYEPVPLELPSERPESMASITCCAQVQSRKWCPSASMPRNSRM